MKFFDHQEAARRRTRLLLVYYALAVILIVAAFYIASRGVAAVALGQLGSAHDPDSGRSAAAAPFRVLAWDPLWLLVTAGASLLVIGGGTLFRRASLAEGGAAVARSAGGREVVPGTCEPGERRLLNVVEEMALASGVPVPRVFVLDEERGVNAFAAGFGLHDAAVAVTRGALSRLSRDELQGVVAHEFSHILNGDMRLNSWLIGVLFGILVTSQIGLGLMRVLGRVRISSGRRKGGGGGIVLVLFLAGLALWVIGSVGVFFARLIQGSVAREREYLADASAVQFTRHPAGLAGALKRIGAQRSGNAIQSPRRLELAHLLFAPASASGFDGLFASHPPLVARIRRIEPDFDGDFRAWARPSAELAGGAPAPDGRPAAAPEHEPEALALARGLPPELREAAAQPESAAALLYALLLGDDAALRQRQRGRLVALEGQPVAAQAEAWRAALRSADPAVRRMVAELAVEGVRQRGSAGCATCVRLVRELSESDGSLSLFEQTLQGRVARRLGAAEGRRRLLPPAALRAEAAVALAALAYAGQPADDSAAEAAWRAGAAQAPAFGAADAPFPSRAECAYAALQAAFERLDGLSPADKGALLAACARVVREDGFLTSDETELLRAFADFLGQPLPV